MDIFGASFDESNYVVGPSSSSEVSSSKRRPSTVHSDEEVILASALPKKRAGRRVFKETRHPVYRGVRRRNKNRWVCEMRVPNDKSRIWLGTYPKAEMAARAHDVAALALRGKSACLNFADSAWRLPLPASANAEEIRRAAVEAAEAFAVVDNCNQQQVDISVKASAGHEVSSVGDAVTVMEDANKPLHMQEEGMYLDEVPAMAEFEDLRLHDLLLRMADEPLRSPPPHSLSFWNDVDLLDAEMSLWSFTV